MGRVESTERATVLSGVAATYGDGTKVQFSFNQESSEVGKNVFFFAILIRKIRGRGGVSATGLITL